MTDEESLLTAVCTTPADETPKLVLADYYDDNDQPDRARWIRNGPPLWRSRDFGRARRGKWAWETPDREAFTKCDYVSGNYLCGLGGFNTKYNYVDPKWRPIAMKLIERSVLTRVGEYGVCQGFVWSVSLTVTEFMGHATCDLCNGSGLRVTESCGGCGGMGTYSGCAKKLFDSHPIENVVSFVNDRRYSEYRPEPSGSHPGLWRWYCSGSPFERMDFASSTLPPALYRCLPDTPTAMVRGVEPYYQSPQEGIYALGRAMWKLGRIVSGLDAPIVERVATNRKEPPPPEWMRNDPGLAWQDTLAME